MRRPMVDNKGRAVSWTFNEVCLFVTNTGGVCTESVLLGTASCSRIQANMKVISSAGEHYPRVQPQRALPEIQEAEQESWFEGRAAERL